LLPKVLFAITAPQAETYIRKNIYFKELKNLNNVQLICGQENNKHLKTLSQSRIVLSCAKQENFGYGIMKATLQGCLPILPNRLCYPDFFDNNFLYKDDEQAAIMIVKFINDNNHVKQSYAKMLSHIRTLSFAPLLQDFFTI